MAISTQRVTVTPGNPPLLLVNPIGPTQVIMNLTNGGALFGGATVDVNTGIRIPPGTYTFNLKTGSAMYAVATSATQISMLIDT